MICFILHSKIMPKPTILKKNNSANLWIFAVKLRSEILKHHNFGTNLKNKGSNLLPNGEGGGGAPHPLFYATGLSTPKFCQVSWVWWYAKVILKVEVVHISDIKLGNPCPKGKYCTWLLKLSDINSIFTIRELLQYTEKN